MFNPIIMRDFDFISINLNIFISAITLMLNTDIIPANTNNFLFMITPLNS